MPTLNEGAVIGRLLRQLQAARQAGHEVVLVDGGSSDGTVRLAAPHVDLLLRSAPGRGRQLNLGARASGGCWLWFLHADSVLPDGWLEQLEAACLGGARSWGFFHVRLDPARWPYRVIAWSMNLRSCLTRMATGDQGIFVQRELFEAVGGYPELPLMEDLALSRRLRREARPHCLRGPLVTSARRWRRHGVVRTVLLMWGLRLAYALGVPARRLARYYRRCTPTSAS